MPFWKKIRSTLLRLLPKNEGFLRESNLNAILENSVDSIITIDKECRILAFNKAAEEMFGYSRKDVMGKNVNMLMPAPYKEEHDGYIHSYVTTGVKHIIGIGREVSGLRKDGTTFPLDLAVSEISVDRNRYFTGIIRDVTAKKEAEKKIQEYTISIKNELQKTKEAKQLLESANAELESFSYSVSHDLQAPLRAISGFSQAVMEDYASKLDADGKRYLNLIQDNAALMGQLIQDLLTFSRLGRQQISTSEIDMESLAKEVFEQVKIQVPNQGVVEFKLGSLPRARGDSAMIRQVFVNLFSNALKFTRGLQVAIIEVGYRKEGDAGFYYVKDNGAGFDMRYVEKLFGVFQRLHTVDEFEGTGIGLALVKRIITRHGGKIWVEGALNQGACFYFTLPQGEN